MGSGNRIEYHVLYVENRAMDCNEQNILFVPRKSRECFSYALTISCQAEENSLNDL